MLVKFMIKISFRLCHVKRYRGIKLTGKLILGWRIILSPRQDTLGFNCAYAWNYTLFYPCEMEASVYSIIRPHNLKGRSPLFKYTTPLLIGWGSELFELIEHSSNAMSVMSCVNGRYFFVSNDFFSLDPIRQLLALRN